MNYKDEYKDFERKMKKTIEFMVEEFDSVRAGKANAAVLNQISVDYYGTPTPIQQIASVSTPDARTLAIQPWDKSALKAIEKAILASDLGINPPSSPRSAERNWSSRCANTARRARWPSAMSAATPWISSRP